VQTPARATVPRQGTHPHAVRRTAVPGWLGSA
jgi:hypothetical protein